MYILGSIDPNYFTVYCGPAWMFHMERRGFNKYFENATDSGVRIDRKR